MSLRQSISKSIFTGSRNDDNLDTKLSNYLTYKDKVFKSIDIIQWFGNLYLPSSILIDLSEIYWSKTSKHIRAKPSLTSAYTS